MTYKEEMFDTIFSAYGGRLDIESLPVKDLLLNIKTEINRMIQSIKSFYPRMPQIHMDFINDLSLNAKATKHQGEYYIGINAGAYFLILDMFQKMLSMSNVLPDIGNSSIESSEKKTLNAILTERGVTILPYDEINKFSMPKCDVRNFYVHVFTNFALHFLVFHECAHIIRGHVGYLSKGKASYIWDELKYHTYEDDQIDPAFFQTLEMDADSFATNRAVINASIALNNPEVVPDNQKNIVSQLEYFSPKLGFCYLFFF